MQADHSWTGRAATRMTESVAQKHSGKASTYPCGDRFPAKWDASPGLCGATAMSIAAESSSICHGVTMRNASRWSMGLCRSLLCEGLPQLFLHHRGPTHGQAGSRGRTSIPWALRLGVSRKRYTGAPMTKAVAGWQQIDGGCFREGAR